MKILHTLVLATLIASTGCATAPKMNRLSLGMTKQEVISAIGKPASTSAAGDGVEVLHYDLSPSGGPVVHLIKNDYFVKILNGKVAAYGKTGDTDLTKGSRIETQHRD